MRPSRPAIRIGVHIFVAVVLASTSIGCDAERSERDSIPGSGLGTTADSEQRWNEDNLEYTASEGREEALERLRAAIEAHPDNLGTGTGLEVASLEELTREYRVRISPSGDDLLVEVLPDESDPGWDMTLYVDEHDEIVNLAVGTTEPMPEFDED